MKLYHHRLELTQLPEPLHLLINDILKQQHANHDYLQLDYDTRQRSRFKAVAESGEAVGIDLERTQTIKQGNILASNDAFEAITQYQQADTNQPSTMDDEGLRQVLHHGIIQVFAKPQLLTKVTAAVVSSISDSTNATLNLENKTATDDFLLMRAAYHLGNRHVPLMLTPDALYFEPDHVLSDMLIGLGVSVNEVQTGFEPETGAYSKGHGGHTHKHAHEHQDAHSHSHQNHSHHSHSHSHGHQHD